MAEESEKNSSGQPPKETYRVLRPTVVSKPTLERTPKPASVVTPSPTVIRAPTVIPGTVRKRIPVTISELRQFSLGLKEEVYAQALALLDTFVIEKISDRKAVMWGYESQKSYSDLVSASMNLSQTSVLTTVRTHLQRMTDILGSTDFIGVCGHSPSLAGGLFKGMNRKIDSLEEWKSAQEELKLLVQHMEDALTELLALSEQLEEYSKKFDEVSLQVEAAALAALYLSDYLEKQGNAFAQRFTERSMSLTQSLAQIRQNDSIRKLQIDEPIRVISVIQNVVLVLMPGFLGSVASKVVLTNNARISPTEAGDLNTSLRTILNHLKS